MVVKNVLSTREKMSWSDGPVEKLIYSGREMW